MSLIAKDGGGKKFDPAPQGSHPARCYSVVDLGTQHDTWQGQPNTRRKLRLAFELPDQTINTDDGPMPMTIGQTYTLSLHEKAALRKDLEAWRGRAFTPEELNGFDLFKLAGVACMLTVIHYKKDDGSTSARIGAIASPPKSMTVPPPVHETICYDIGMGQNSVFKKLPEWMQKQIVQCDEFHLPPPGEPDPKTEVADTFGDDDVPF